MGRILIIGGCGYIGSQLFVYLKNKGYKVDTVDLEWLRNNVDNFALLLEKLENQKLIFASSYRVYPLNKKILFRETYNLRRPLTYYDLAKQTIEHYAQMSKVEYYGLRMATLNGFSPNLRDNQIINKLFLSSLNNVPMVFYAHKKLFSILGIQDLCRAVERIIESDDKRGLYNLKSFDSTIQLLARKVANYAKSSQPILKDAPKPHGSVIIDSSKFSRIFKFKFIESPKSIIESLENLKKNKRGIITSN